MEQIEMTEQAARTILSAMQATAEVDTFHLEERIEKLKDELLSDGWEETGKQIERLQVRLTRRTREAAALAIAVAHLPLDASRETHDIYKAWQFVAESYEPYSPDRSGWTDEDILNFVDQHHTIGLDAFKKTGN